MPTWIACAIRGKGPALWLTSFSPEARAVASTWRSRRSRTTPRPSGWDGSSTRSVRRGWTARQPRVLLGFGPGQRGTVVLNALTPGTAEQYVDRATCYAQTGYK